MNSSTDLSQSSARVILLGLLALALVLRLLFLDRGIWYDEMRTYVDYMPLGWAELFTTYNDANNHMLFSLFAKASLQIFGDSVWAFRLPAALFGVATIAALYHFARRVTGTQEALFAAALLTVSYHHIWFSQNARGYTILLFFTILSSLYLLDALRGNQRSRWFLFAATAFLGAYTHLTMAFVALGQLAVYASVAVRQDSPLAGARLRGLFLGFLLLGVLTLVGYFPIIRDLFTGALLNSGLENGQIEWSNPLWAFMEVVNGLRVGFAGGGVVLIAAIVFMIGLGSYLATRPAVVVLFLVPTLTALILMTSIGYTLFPRFFFFGAGFAILIVIRGAFVSAGWAGRLLGLAPRYAAALPYLAASLVIIASILSLRHVYLPKQDFEAAVNLIEAELRPGDTVMAVGIAAFPFNDYHGRSWSEVSTADEVAAIRQNSDRSWLVWTMPLHARAVYSDVLAVAEQDYNLFAHFYASLNGGDILVYVEDTE